MSTVPPAPGYFSDQPATLAGAAGSGSGLVSQVRVVALLNAVEGGLELSVAAFGLFIGMILLVVPAEIQRQGGGNPRALAAIYLTVGGVNLILGSLRLLASWRNYFFHNRGLGIVSLCVGLISTFAGCCAITSVGVAIYGLIVFFDTAVIDAFQRRSQGASVEEILGLPAAKPPGSA
jgi:hypothetical protein